jgi:hypothetical protein
MLHERQTAWRRLMTTNLAFGDEIEVEYRVISVYENNKAIWL